LFKALDKEKQKVIQIIPRTNAFTQEVSPLSFRPLLVIKADMEKGGGPFISYGCLM
jgi:hypothetical protein